MNQNAVGAVFYAIFSIFKIPSAAISHRIERAKAKKTIEIFFIGLWVAGKVFTFFVFEIFATHFLSSFVNLRLYVT